MLDIQSSLVPWLRFSCEHGLDGKALVIYLFFSWGRTERLHWGTGKQFFFEPRGPDEYLTDGVGGL